MTDCRSCVEAETISKVVEWLHGAACALRATGLADVGGSAPRAVDSVADAIERGEWKP